MNKKLTAILFAVLLLLIGKVDAATLTQKLGNSSTSLSVKSGQQVTLRFTNKANYTFSSWAVESGGITIDTTNPTITFTMPDANVVIRANYAEEVAGIAGRVNVGDYVTYVPSSTSYTVPSTASKNFILSEQNFNPSSTTSWRVFSNNGTNVEIISADIANYLSLNGKIGYKNGVQTLNDMSAAYVNPTYAISGRSLGYYDATRYTSETNSGSAMTETELANYQTINITSTPITSGASGFPYIDYQYMPDVTILTDHGLVHQSEDAVWLASRYVYNWNQGNSSEFAMHLFWGEDNGVGNRILYVNHDDGGIGTEEKHERYGVRPVITLKPTVTITGGSGTASDPYIINTTNPSQYTITYCANGGYGEMMPQSVSQGNSITLRANTYEHHEKAFLGWSTSATATSATYTDGQSITPTADMTLYPVWGEAPVGTGDLASRVSVGDYVTYVPSSTSYTMSTTVSGYTSNQTYNPSTVTSWRVFSKDGGNVEIISTNSAGDLTLYQETGYRNAVQALNEICASYVNPMYAISGRSLGYSEEGLTYEQLTNYKILNESKYSVLYLSNDECRSLPYDDRQYADDLLIMQRNSLYSSSKWVWLASRQASASSEVATFGGRLMISDESGCRSNDRNFVYERADGDSGYYNLSGYGEMMPQSVSRGSSLTLRTNTYEHHSKVFAGWAISPNSTTITYTDGQSITPTADMTLYAIWKTGTKLSGKVNVGDYITYVPSSTSYTVPTTVSGYGSNQKFNPSSTTSWRVFSKDGTTVEIISTDSVGTLSLKGEAGYVNAVQTLNDMSVSFVNPTYATSARSLGYSTDGLSDVNNYKVIKTATYPIEYGATRTFPYYDSQYTADKTVLVNHGAMYHSSGYVWLASRAYGTDSSDSMFSINGISMGNGISTYAGTRIYSDDTVVDFNNGNGVRPIITLKSTVSITGGSGTAADPYIINTTNPSQYTVTYCANGGYGEMMPQSNTDNTIILRKNTYEHHDKAFLGWSTSATATTPTYVDGQSITLTADTTLYAVWGEKTLLETKVNVGDYIIYIPSNSSYTVYSDDSGSTDQTYKPSSITNWRVFSNDGTTVEIISSESVGTLTLQGYDGYVRLVQTLQNMSAAYVNPTYATSGRSLGYSEANFTADQIANYKVINTSQYPLNESYEAGFPYADEQYAADLAKVKNNSLGHSTGYVWLASRDSGESETYSVFYYGNVMDKFATHPYVSDLYSYELEDEYDEGGWLDGTVTSGVRPIITLKSGLGIIGGSGTKTDPYVIEGNDIYKYGCDCCGSLVNVQYCDTCRFGIGGSITSCRVCGQCNYHVNICYNCGLCENDCTCNGEDEDYAQCMCCFENWYFCDCNSNGPTNDDCTVH